MSNCENLNSIKIRGEHTREKETTARSININEKLEENGGTDID